MKLKLIKSKSKTFVIVEITEEINSNDAQTIIKRYKLKDNQLLKFGEFSNEIKTEILTALNKKGLKLRSENKTAAENIFKIESSYIAEVLNLNPRPRKMLNKIFKKK